jgi:hypothetical protein
LIDDSNHLAKSLKDDALMLWGRRHFRGSKFGEHLRAVVQRGLSHLKACPEAFGSGYCWGEGSSVAKDWRSCEDFDGWPPASVGVYESFGVAECLSKLCERQVARMTGWCAETVGKSAIDDGGFGLDPIRLRSRVSQLAKSPAQVAGAWFSFDAKGAQDVGLQPGEVGMEIAVCGGAVNGDCCGSLDTKL